MTTKRRYYQQQARDIVRDLRVDKDLTYSELARRLRGYGVVIETQSLINKINRGTYSFTFALQVLAAMGVTSIQITQPPAGRRGGAIPILDFDPSDDV